MVMMPAQVSPAEVQVAINGPGHAGAHVATTNGPAHAGVPGPAPQGGRPPSVMRMVSLTKFVEDDDVAAERHRIEQSDFNYLHDSLILKQLTKYYGGFLAVDNLSIGIKQGKLQIFHFS